MNFEEMKTKDAEAKTEARKHEAAAQAAINSKSLEALQWLTGYMGRYILANEFEVWRTTSNQIFAKKCDRKLEISVVTTTSFNVFTYENDKIVLSAQALDEDGMGRRAMAWVDSVTNRAA